LRRLKPSLNQRKEDQDMKRRQTLTVTLIGTLMCSLLIVSAASAETTLLAEWLVNNAAVTGSEKVKLFGEVILEDEKAGLAGKVAVKCSIAMFGIVSPDGADTIEKLFPLSGAEVKPLEGAGLSCTSVSGCELTGIEVWAMNFPWKSLLFLMENGKFLDLVESIDWTIKCKIFGMPFEDECSSADGEFAVENGVSGEVLVQGGLEPKLSCTISKEVSGKMEAPAGQPLLLTTENGLTPLAVSSE
jgi:hypothetical protein